MAHPFDTSNRSVNAGTIAGATVMTGDNNSASTTTGDVTAHMPPAGTVNPREELASLRERVLALELADRGRVERALADAEEEAQKDAPDTGEIGDALERVARYTRTAADFADNAARLHPHVAALAAWLSNPQLLAAFGLAGLA